jgi:hypothetical protein
MGRTDHEQRRAQPTENENNGRIRVHSSQRLADRDAYHDTVADAHVDPVAYNVTILRQAPSVRLDDLNLTARATGYNSRRVERPA